MIKMNIKIYTRIFLISLGMVSSWMQLQAVSQEVVPGAEEAVSQGLEEGDGQEKIPSVVQETAQGDVKTVIDLLDLKNMDILDVLKLISQKSGLNIVAGQNVKGKVTVYLKNIAVMEALRIIVEAYDWAYVEDGDIIKVMTDKELETKYGYKFSQKLATRIKPLLYAKPADVLTLLTQVKSASGRVVADEKSNTLILTDIPIKLDEMETIIKEIDVPIKRQIFQLSYAMAEEISKSISDVLTPNVGTMKFDVRSNTLIVSDTAAKLESIAKMIETFDQKDKEVLIDAKILQIVLNDQYKWGVDWEGIISDYQALTLKSDFDILTDSDKKGRISIGILPNDDYSVLIEALDTVGETNILSSPRITTINNKEAKILVGSTTPYVTSTTTSSSGTSVIAESVNFIDVGVKLYVTPTIHEDNFITMKIKPEVSSVTSNVTTSSNNTIPVVETSEAETNVTVKDDVTIVIGGLMKDEKIKSTKKIPLLGDIPLLGVAFRNISDQNKKTEIVIFLKPKIVTGDVAEDMAVGSLR